MTTFEGRPVSLMFEPSSRVFNYTFRPDPAISLPTEAKKTYTFIEDNPKDLRAVTEKLPLCTKYLRICRVQSSVWRLPKY